MKYKLLLFILLFSLEGQGSNRFSDKVNMKKFTKEYWKTDRNKSNEEESKKNILKLIKKFSDKHNVDLNVSDTIFILETCSIEYSTCYGNLWSQNKSFSFISQKSFKSVSNTYFKTEEVNALFKWEEDIFKSLDEEGHLWLPQDTRFATRIVIYDGNINIERKEYLYY